MSNDPRIAHLNLVFIAFINEQSCFLATDCTKAASIPGIENRANVPNIARKNWYSPKTLVDTTLVKIIDTSNANDAWNNRGKLTNPLCLVNEYTSIPRCLFNFIINLLIVCFILCFMHSLVKTILRSVLFYYSSLSVTFSLFYVLSYYFAWQYCLLS